MVGSAEEDEDEVVAWHVRRQRQVVTLDLRGAGHANGGRCSVAVATTYTYNEDALVQVETSLFHRKWRKTNLKLTSST